MDPSFARRMWALLEPYHALIYFAPEVRQSLAEAGFKGGWMGYFATRSAPMGAVSAATVTATFYNFHPRMVERAIPDAWHFSSPEAALEGRLRVVDLAVRRMFDDLEPLTEVAELAARAAAACRCDGRPLAAANQALEAPQEPHLLLWQAVTTLREMRGDGHVASLVSHEIDGCAAHVLFEAAGGPPGDMQRRFRGWSEAEWNDARARLRDRGLLDSDGGATEQGMETHRAIESDTDRLAVHAWAVLGESGCERLADLVRPIRERLVESQAIVFPNPIGLPQDVLA